MTVTIKVIILYQKFPKLFKQGWLVESEEDSQYRWQLKQGNKVEYYTILYVDHSNNLSV